MSRCFLFVAAALVAGCQPQGGTAPTITPAGSPDNTKGPAVGPAAQPTLAESRKGFQSKLRPQKSVRDPVDEPPPRVFQKVHYDSPVGKLAAYLTPDPKDGKKHPAVVWITGGDCN